MSTDESCMLADVDAMESTPCELHVEHLHKGALSELSAISATPATPATPAQVDPVGKTEEQQLKVYLRVRPFSKEEISNNEDQGCVVLESAEVAVLQAPKESLTMKNSEKGIGQAMHKFSFSQIFGPETTQTNFFESTVRSLVFNYLAGQNALVFTYGVTNAGKTHTIQGSVQDPGILPRALDLIFNHIKGKQYEQMDLKPYLGSDVQYLDSEQVQMEKSTKAAVFALLKEENDPSLKAGGSATAMKSMSKSPSTASLSFSSVSYDQSGLFDSTDSEQDTSKFSVWVCFFEIYNECVYDLLDLIPTSKGKKRNALRVCEDTSGNSYVRGLKWIYVQNTEEACKILKIGNKNRSAASTKMNQSSSRSHSIFTIKLLRIQGTEVQKISELSLCDLAGSERCNKTKTFGERLKEAGNINNSLLILGKCISALRQNQNVKTKNSYVPFRESKLTRLFQSIFCGKGRACMIVNINQCASTYDETLHVMKFSAVAKQVVQIITPKTLESIAPRLVGRDGKPLVKNGVIDNEALESYLSEEELLDEDDDDEADMSILPQEELLNIIESLKEKLLVERRRNLVQEIEIRKEMGDAMLQQLMESEETRRQIEELKDSYEEKLENTFDMYKDAIKEHAYQCALERVEDEYVPVEEFLEEQKHVEELQKKLAETAHRLKAFQDPLAPQTMESSTRCSPETDIAGMQDQLKKCFKSCAEDVVPLKGVLNENQALSEANSLSERLHEQKDEIIKSLKKKIDEMNETLQEAGESFREKEAEIKDFLERILQQDQAIERLQSSNSELEIVVSQLREDLQRLNQLSKEVSEQPRPKRGLLANIKASVSSPVKLPLSRTLKKSVKSTPRSTQKMAL